MTIRIDQIADAIISAPGTVVKVLDFVPNNLIYTNSLTFVDVSNGVDIAEDSFQAQVKGNYVLAVDLDTTSVASGSYEVTIHFRLIIDKGLPEEKVVAPDAGYWSQTHSSISIHRQMSFVSPPVLLEFGSHTVTLQWCITDNSSGREAQMTGLFSFVHINAMSSGASGAGGILVDSYSIIDSNLTYNNTNWEDILIENGGHPLHVQFDSMAHEAVGVNLLLDAYSSTWSSARWAEFRVLLDDITEVAWSKQTFNANNLEEEVGLTAYITELTKGSHILKAQVRVENSDLAVSLHYGSSRGKLEVIRFRGGLVPIQNNGLSIVNTPSAINFIGSNVSITDVLGVATISFSGAGGNFISQGNTLAKVIDTGVDGYFVVGTEGVERFRITRDGGTIFYNTAVAPDGYDGMVYYDTVLNRFEFYQNGVWTELGSGGGTLNQSYNFGGAGAGRIITVNAGAVEMNAGGEESLSIDGYFGLKEIVEPNPLANKGLLYSQEADGKTELFYMDNAGDATQITSDGYLATANSLTRVGLYEHNYDPPGHAGEGFLYAKPVGDCLELFFMDSKGRAIQITKDGSLNLRSE